MGEDIEKRFTFQDYAIVACGTVNMELNALRDIGFLDAAKILYTKPGRHEIHWELEAQLIRQIAKAKEYANKIIVAYGGKFCYVNVNDLYRGIDTIIKEQEEPPVTITIFPSRVKISRAIFNVSASISDMVLLCSAISHHPDNTSFQNS